MKFQIGDKVLLLHSKEEGEVKEILNDEMVLVEVDGIRFPVYQDQIDFPYFYQFTAAQKNKKIEDYFVESTSKQKGKLSGKIEETGVRVVFTPIFNKDIFDEDVVKFIKIDLANHSADDLNFVFHIPMKEGDGLSTSGELKARSVVHLHQLDFESMNDIPKFEFEFSLVHPQKGKPEYFETNLKLKAKIFFKKLEEMRLKKQDSFSFELFENYPDSPADMAPDYNPNSEVLYRAEKAKEQLPSPRSVVDLHIEKLSDDWKSLSNFEILTIQLSNFEKYYDLAVAHRQPNLIIIHGVGTGKLKNEIHELLKHKTEVKSFANQYHPNFGFGATEVFFQYN